MSSYKNLEALVEKYIHQYQAISLVLESVQQERDEYRDLYSASHEKLEAAERERDELRAIAEEQSKLAGSNAARAQKAEAEIARRDAAAGEPEFYVRYRSDGGYEGPLHKDATEECRKQSWSPLYTAAPPAVLPPEMNPEPEKYDVIDHGFIAGYNQCRADSLALGAQQQKVVEFPKPHAHLIWIQAGRAPDDYWDDVEVSHSPKDRCCDGSERYAVFSEFEVKDMLDAANVKWEVKK